MSQAPSHLATGAGRAAERRRSSSDVATAQRRRVSPERRRRATARRRRRLRGLIRFAALVAVIAFAVWIGATVANASNDPGSFSEQSYTVQPGDTLWAIAARHYGDDTDLREIVWKIGRRNGLDRAELFPGQVLTLPPTSTL